MDAAPGAQLVRCEPLHALLSLRACLTRHTSLWPSGAARGVGALYPFCHACPMGARRLRQAARWFTPGPVAIPRVVLPLLQRRARLLHILSSLPDHAEDPDPFWGVAASLSPDDSGIDFAGQ